VTGGPGMGNRADRLIFKESAFCFWDQPSKNLKESLQDLSDFVSKKREECDELIFFAHSFGTQYLLRLSSDIINKIDRIILSAPDFYPHQTDLNILRLASSNLTREKNPVAPKLEREIQKLSLDEQPFHQKLPAIELAAQDQSLMLCYFADRAKAQDFFSMMGENPLNFETYLNIRKQLDESPLLETSINHPCQILLGNVDPVINIDQAHILAQAWFPHSELHKISNSGHFPHIEGQALFFKLIGTPPRLRPLDRKDINV
jgi:pimeloyl-ACP methyl ester carboxylesterase